MPKGACKGQQRKKGLGAEFLGKVPAMHVVTPEQSPQTGRVSPLPQKHPGSLSIASRCARHMSQLSGVCLAPRPCSWLFKAWQSTLRNETPCAVSAPSSADRVRRRAAQGAGRDRTLPPLQRLPTGR